MKIPEISIIVPVYNVESYLVQCIESILCQSFNKWECWLIDDGSTDSSGHICDDYAQKDSRLFVIHKKNEGVASARQCGLNHSTGKYIVSIDSDDWVDADYLQSMYECATQNDAEIVLCDYFFYQDGIDKYTTNKPSSTQPLIIQNEAFEGKIHAGLWCKMFQRKLFLINKVGFPIYSYYEDMFTLVSLLQFAKNIVYLPKATYHYRYNPQSYTYNKDVNKRINMCKELFENMYALDKLYQISTHKETSKSFEICINFAKRYLITRYFNRATQIKPLLRYYPQSTKLKDCKNISDICFYLAARHHFFCPYNLRNYFFNRNNE